MSDGENPGASPVIGRGAGGAIGYATAIPGTADEAEATPAGVVGFGGSAAFGLFGRGSSGIVGYEQSTPRDPVFDSLGGAGVLGRGPVGMRAEGTTGPGVHARGTPGLQALSRVGPATVSEGQVGIYASGRPGPGVVGVSAGDRAAILSSRRNAQLWLIPLDDAIQSPAQLTGTAQAGELLVTEAVGEDGVRVATLWFCKSSGGPGEAQWVKLA